MKTPKASIIITTYNSKEWLKKVLYGYNQQTQLDFEIVIADDGSRNDTKELIDVLKTQMLYNINHVWHEDNGFQKTKILNKAILKTKSDYLIISDGDCIPRRDFVETHVKNSKEGYILSGGYFKLPMNISKMITKKDIEDQKCFDINWLVQNGLKRNFKSNKLTSKGLIQKILNNFTPTKATWNGANSSGWKKDIIAVNGFDERMQYGGLDREMGERLFNLGIKSKQIRYSAILVHLDHARGYENKDSWKLNNSIRKHTKSKKITWTDFGIKK